MRAKWSAPIRKYWKISEQMMVKYCDLAICDSVNGDSPIRLSAITAGGSQAVFFKVNTLGEESFLDDVKDLLEEILEE